MPLNFFPLAFSQLICLWFHFGDSSGWEGLGFPHCEVRTSGWEGSRARPVCWWMELLAGPKDKQQLSGGHRREWQCFARVIQGHFWSSREATIQVDLVATGGPEKGVFALLWDNFYHFYPKHLASNHWRDDLSNLPNLKRFKWFIVSLQILSTRGGVTYENIFLSSKFPLPNMDIFSSMFSLKSLHYKLFAWTYSPR